MISILDIPDFRKQAVKTSVEQYHRLIELGELDQSTELLSGYVIEKMSKSPLHRFLVKKLFAILTAAIDPTTHDVWKEDPLTFNDSEPEPDLAIIDISDNDYRIEHPNTAQLVIEVAISSVKIDQAKATIYADAGVNEYWIVRPEDKQIDVYRNPKAGVYTETMIVPADEKLASSQLDTLQITLADLLE